MELTFNDFGGAECKIELKPGQQIYVLGANGTGKSALMHKAYVANPHSRRILAHRKTWFESNSSGLTASQRNQTVRQVHSQNNREDSRWRDNLANERTNLCLFNLIDAINVLARQMDEAVRADDAAKVTELRKTEQPLKVINNLFATANLPIAFALDEGDQFFATKSGSERYSIAQLSDGERNAFVIAAEVLTAPADSLVIIDEPERHLHRSIISPLLTALFDAREDCAFLVSTHEVELPIDNSDADVLLIRACRWTGNSVDAWDTDLISQPSEIPNDIKRGILGARRKLLFVEGQSASLDRQLYEILFPNISVVPVGSCVEVERAVAGVASTGAQHWVTAYGIVDLDNRTREQVADLAARGLYSIPHYSIESIYYSNLIVGEVAGRQAGVTGESADELQAAASSAVIADVQGHRDRLCRLMVLQVADTELSRNSPDTKDIERGTLGIALDLAAILAEEQLRFDTLIANEDSDGLIARYPVRTTPALQSIALALGFRTRAKYESAVRKLLIDSEECRASVRELFGSLGAELD